MTDKPDSTRRALLGGVPMFVALSACGSEDESNSPWVYDPARPNDIVRTYAKIAGSTEERQLYLQYYGEIISVIPGEVQRPLFRLKGLVRQRWHPNTNSFMYSNYDHGLFCDWESGKVIERYENPFTREVNTPLHYNSGELSATIGLGEGQENPLSKEWRTVGDQLSVTRTRIGREFPNPVSPDVYPRASTGTNVQYSWTSTYFADARELSDSRLSSVSADHTWMFLTNFPAWMRVGDLAGFALWRWSAKKILNREELDPYILGEIEARKPGFLTVDKPWPERSDGWTQYSRERTPE